MTRVCVGIRTHQFGVAEAELYGELVSHFPPENVFLVTDETARKVEVPRGVKKIGFDRVTLTTLDLLSDFQRVGWLCGDYFYYVLRRAVEAPYYWLIEPDVRFTYAHVGEFFRPCDAFTADLLLCRFGRRDAAWMWHESARCISESVFGCAFPVSRVSGRAADVLLGERQRLSREFAGREKAWTAYPNDEAFVATQAMVSGLSCTDLMTIHPSAFRHFSVLYPYAWPRARRVLPPGQVVHPAIQEADFDNAFARYMDGVFARCQEMRRLVEHALSGADESHRRRVRGMLAGGVLEHVDRLVRESRGVTVGEKDGEAAAHVSGAADALWHGRVSARRRREQGGGVESDRWRRTAGVSLLGMLRSVVRWLRKGVP